ncbi:MAG: hypothetical protein IH621_03100 [Krumholzibacteria bacterium]|nr:hypothetical protein [Candidatus Krumholzibacteria bacterium]
MTVLILTYSDDPHATAVCEWLEDEGTPFVRIDTDKYPFEHEPCFQHIAGNASWSIQIGMEVIPSTALRSIWHRRIQDPDTATAGVSSDEHRIIVSERDELLRALVTAFDGFVLCDRDVYEPLDRKCYQYQLAARFGFNIPDTLVTTSVTLARAFYEDHNRDVIFKLQRSQWIDYPTGRHAVYSQPLNEEDLVLDHLWKSAPCLVQERIPKAFEVRATVVGDQVFACAIHSQDYPDTRHDYRRYNFDEVSHRAIALPEEVEATCTRFVRSLGLYFASIDFAVTPTGKFVFLDLNPNGQWLWTEKLAGLPISRAIATILQSPPVHV